MFESINSEYKNLSLALGFFDGVHSGHKKVISMAVEYARSNNCKSAVITFNNHPSEIMGRNVQYITTPELRDKLIHSLGADYIFSIDFTEKLLNTSCDEYLEMLVNKFHPSAITTGFNHTFGKSKYGNSKLLEAGCTKFGYKYFKIPPQILNGEIISSSLIRKELSEGDIISANSALGRNFSFSGKVIYGRQIGRTIGFPTANLIYPQKLIQIPYGVYSTDIITNGRLFKGLMNFGTKPTIDNENVKPLAEVYIFDFDRDIYGETIEVMLKTHIRGEQKFNSLDELKQQISKDVKSC